MFRFVYMMSVDCFNRETVCFAIVQVNQNFAINLVAEEPVSDVETRVVSCDGGGGALGHPKVYINLVIQLFNK